MRLYIHDRFLSEKRIFQGIKWLEVCVSMTGAIIQKYFLLVTIFTTKNPRMMHRAICTGLNTFFWNRKDFCEIQSRDINYLLEGSDDLRSSANIYTLKYFEAHFKFSLFPDYGAGPVLARTLVDIRPYFIGARLKS